MTHLSAIGSSWLIVAALFCGEVNAQAHGSISREQRDPEQSVPDRVNVANEKKRAELDGWLRRLVGRFQVGGSVLQAINNGDRVTRKIGGVMDCTSIGDGPGVRCLIKASWPPISYLPLGGGAAPSAASEAKNTLNPAVMLFALDPDALKIEYQLVDDHSIADAWSGQLTGSTVVFISHDKSCWGPLSLVRCPLPQQVTAKPGGKIITMLIASENASPYIEISLKREIKNAAAVAPNEQH